MVFVLFVVDGSTVDTAEGESHVRDGQKDGVAVNAVLNSTKRAKMRFPIESQIEICSCPLAPGIYHIIRSAAIFASSALLGSLLIQHAQTASGLQAECRDTSNRRGETP